MAEHTHRPVTGERYRRSVLRMSNLFLRTLRDDPSDAEVPSHKLLVRAGYIRRAAPGGFTWLPLGFIVLRNVERVIREEMDAAGFQEVHFPALLPKEPYEATGRWVEYGPNLFRLQDRHGADPARSAVHQQALAIAEHAAFEHIVPNSEQRFGERGSLVQWHVVGHRQAMLPGRGAIFGIAATRRQCSDPRAEHFSRHRVTHGNDFARNLEPENWRGPRGSGVIPSALDTVRAVHPRIDDPNQDITRSALRHGDGFRPKHVWSTRLVEAH